MKPYIMRNGGWVTAQLDNKEAITGAISGAVAKAQNPITTYRVYITVQYLYTIFAI